jgi:hypothetical protein
MSSVYINDFDQPTYQYKYVGPINLGHINIERLLTGFEPAYSQFLFLYTARSRSTGYLSASVLCCQEHPLRLTHQP